MPGRAPTTDSSPGGPPPPPGPLVAEVLGVVRAMLVDVIGPEHLAGLPIELDTSLDADLELESLEFVELAERLLKRYGREVDFISWLAGKEVDDIIGLTVGDVVAFIAASLSAPEG